MSQRLPENNPDRPGQSACPDIPKGQDCAGPEKLIFVVGPRKVQNELMASYLERETGIQCTGLRKISDISPDHRKNGDADALLMLDCGGKATDAFIETLQHLWPGCIVCLFNARKEDVEPEDLIGKIRGLFFEGDSIDQLVKGIKAMFEGGLWLSRKSLERFVLNNGQTRKNGSNPPLTKKEMEILVMVWKGASNHEIADKHCISYRTVKVHLYNIFKKLNVTSRMQAALWATQNLDL
jgi:LuxR family transcriptional regulator of csgAB operon